MRIYIHIQSIKIGALITTVAAEAPY